MPISQTQMAMVPTCEHPELRDPIQGEILPCQVTRSNEEFCGVSGKYWEEKVVSLDPPVTPSLIALT